jgi:hypothetical protein
MSSKQSTEMRLYQTNRENYGKNFYPPKMDKNLFARIEYFVANRALSP